MCIAVNYISSKQEGRFENELQKHSQQHHLRNKRRSHREGAVPGRRLVRSRNHPFCFSGADQADGKSELHAKSQPDPWQLSDRFYPKGTKCLYQCGLYRGKIRFRADRACPQIKRRTVYLRALARPHLCVQGHGAADSAPFTDDLHPQTQDRPGNGDSCRHQR